jgi:hypothetical protein
MKLFKAAAFLTIIRSANAVSNRHERRQRAAIGRHVAKAVSSIGRQFEDTIVGSHSAVRPDDIDWQSGDSP